MSASVYVWEFDTTCIIWQIIIKITAKHARVNKKINLSFFSDKLFCLCLLCNVEVIQRVSNLREHSFRIWRILHERFVQHLLFIFIIVIIVVVLKILARSVIGYIVAQHGIFFLTKIQICENVLKTKTKWKNITFIASAIFLRTRYVPQIHGYVDLNQQCSNRAQIL